MGKRLFLGMLKGLVLGGAIGALLHFVLEQSTVVSWLNYVLYALVGAVAGVFAGRPPWRAGAWVASILKGVFGLAVGAGLYALGSRFLPGMTLPVATDPGALSLAHHPLVFAPLVAMVYATFVEVDDGGDQPEEAVTTGVRAGKISVEDIDVGEDEAAAAKPADKSAKKS